MRLVTVRCALRHAWCRMLRGRVRAGSDGAGSNQACSATRLSGAPPLCCARSCACACARAASRASDACHCGLCRNWPQSGCSGLCKRLVARGVVKQVHGSVLGPGSVFVASLVMQLLRVLPERLAGVPPAFDFVVCGVRPGALVVVHGSIRTMQPQGCLMARLRATSRRPAAAPAMCFPALFFPDSKNLLAVAPCRLRRARRPPRR